MAIDPASAQDRLSTVARYATRSVPIARPDESAAEVIEAMRGRQYRSAGLVAVLDGDQLRGLVTVEQLLAAPPATPVSGLMDTDPPTVAPSVGQEQAAWQAVHHDEPTLAVVDEGSFVGLVPATALLEVLLVEHDEDMVRLGGFMRSASPAQTTTLEPVLHRLWHRLPWLGVGLLGALLAAGVVGHFEADLAENVLIAFFVPGVVYLADAIGTQTEALVIRGLSLGVGVRRIARRELATGALLGLILGGASLLIVGLLWQDWQVALAVALSLLAAATIASAIALVLPWVINRMNKDPAFGSGPLATVIQDLLTVTIYLFTASVLVT